MSNRMLTFLPALALVAALAVSAPALAASSGGGSSDRRSSGDEVDEMFQRGMELVEQGKFADALEKFETAHKKRKKDPEILNMLAYTQRKLGNLEAAFENYDRALGIKPRFPQAREYLGEAHIQAVLLQIKVLRGYGKEGEKELAELVGALRAAADGLEPDSPGRSKPASEKKW